MVGRKIYKLVFILYFYQWQQVINSCLQLSQRLMNTNSFLYCKYCWIDGLGLSIHCCHINNSSKASWRKILKHIPSGIE